MLQPLRRIIQSLVVSLIIFIPLLSTQNTAILQHPAVPKGSPWSLTLFGYHISDPLAVLGTIFASREIYIPFLWTAVVPIIFTVLLGKVYCGWICPMNFISEFNDRLRDLLKKTGYRQHNLVFKHHHKYYVLGGGLFITALLGIQTFALVYPPAVLSREVFYLAFFHSFGAGLYWIFFILIFELTISRRWWCRYCCPGGALLSLVGQYRLLVIRGNQKVCKDCLKCIGLCPLGLNPLQDGIGRECNNCGVCISKCPENVLGFNLRFASLN
ncbi:MAG: 4Fe-4S binding protein [Proteobacteria bacterium]|nr:4Fe-4S binding protein [Pseudomonadota bacterium]